jgi:hypothetical protein
MAQKYWVTLQHGMEDCEHLIPLGIFSNKEKAIEVIINQISKSRGNDMDMDMDLEPIDKLQKQLEIWGKCEDSYGYKICQCEIDKVNKV